MQVKASLSPMPCNQPIKGMADKSRHFEATGFTAALSSRKTKTMSSDLLLERHQWQPENTALTSLHNDNIPLCIQISKPKWTYSCPLPPLQLTGDSALSSAKPNSQTSNGLEFYSSNLKRYQEALGSHPTIPSKETTLCHTKGTGFSLAPLGPISGDDTAHQSLDWEHISQKNSDSY